MLHNVRLTRAHGRVRGRGVRRAAHASAPKAFFRSIPHRPLPPARVRTSRHSGLLAGRNLADDQLCPRREIRINHQDRILKDDPAVVADCVRSIRYRPLMKIDIRSNKISSAWLPILAFHRVEARRYKGDLVPRDCTPLPLVLKFAVS